MANINDTLTAFIKESFLPGLPGVQFDENTSFLDSGLIDSTGVLELVDFLEESFDIEVEDSELIPENLDSIKNLSNYLESKGVASSAG